MKIYNSLSKTIEEFIPIQNDLVKIYNCGPTVYYYCTIGNWRTYIFADTLKRSLLYLGYEVKQVINITDVGHLDSDGDQGIDKLEKGALREKKTVWEIAQFYMDDFISSLKDLNIREPNIFCRATEHIPEQIEMIQKLIDKGYAYIAPSAVYYDVSKFKDYTKLSGQKLNEKKTGVRDEVVVDKDKRNPQDFRLWQLDQPHHQMLWDSPWGKGFPGWHIECSAMSVKYLGQPFDIHTGGVDHISIHHTNEIAQAEAANGVKFVNYWLHNEYLTVDGKRMGKSQGNGYTLSDIKGFFKNHFGYESKNSLMALKYLYLTGHYRNKMDFTLNSFYSSFQALFNIYKETNDIYISLYDSLQNKELTKIVRLYNNKDIKNGYKGNKFIDSLIRNISNDIDTSSVIADLNTLLVEKSIDDIDKFITILEYDKILGLNILKTVTGYINVFDESENVIIKERNLARTKKDYQKADKLRKELELKGIEINDRKILSIYYKK